MLYSSDMVSIPAMQQEGETSGFLIPWIYCRNIYMSESIYGGHRFHAFFLSKEKADREGNLIFYWIRDQM